MSSDKPAEKMHPIKWLMESPWILLVVGFVLPFLSYTVWGWIEVYNLPQATLP